jgi:deoxyribonuclease IV
MSDRKIGAHVSAAGGIDKAVQRVAEIGGNCLQVFSGSPRVWKRKSLSEIDFAKFAAAQAELKISPVVTHALYLVNLASDKPELVEKSIKVLKHDLNFDSLIKGIGVIVHLGSHQGRGWEADRQQVADSMAKIIEDTPANSRFLIENSAGQKGKLASDLHEVRWLIDELSKRLGAKVAEQRLGWCFDTCHAHCAGYALGEETLAANIGDGMGLAATAISELELWSWLKVIHVNDARDPYASGRDRHANLGEGEIPLADIQGFLNLPQVQSLPLILEVPGENKSGPNLKNIDFLKKILG